MSAAMLESLPTELKKQILQHIPDVETLSSIVHASPVMHQVYITTRQQILTRVTINEMLGKGIDVTPASCVQVRMQPRYRYKYGYRATREALVGLFGAFLAPVGLSHELPSHTISRRAGMLKQNLLQISLYRLLRDYNPVIGLEIAQCKLLRRLEGIIRLEHNASVKYITSLPRHNELFSCAFNLSNREQGWGTE